MAEIQRSKFTNIVALITHSLSEIDVLLPIFSTIKPDDKIQIEVVLATRTIYRQYQHSTFYRFCFQELSIKVSYCLLPNKFDPGFRYFLQRMPHRVLVNIFFFALRSVQYARLFRRLRAATLLLHEFSNQTLSTQILYRLHKKYATPICVYDHGHAIRLAQSRGNQMVDAERVTLLNFHEHNRKTFLDQGFIRQNTIGYPKFFPQWLTIVNKYIGHLSIGSSGDAHNKYVIVFSRHVHPYYMDKNIYAFLLTTTIQSIRNTLGLRRIIIKPHPRESIHLIKAIIEENNFAGVEISNEHAAVLSRGALLAISFWGSVILDPLSLDVPAVEYYIEAKRFREVEVEGSSYRNLGIDSVDNPNELENFIRRVSNDEYTIPTIISNLRREIYLDTLFGTIGL